MVVHIGDDEDGDRPAALRLEHFANGAPVLGGSEAIEWASSVELPRFVAERDDDSAAQVDALVVVVAEFRRRHAEACIDELAPSAR